MSTILNTSGERFLINGQPTYKPDGARERSHGLLMNARFIQGIFHDAADEERFQRFGRGFEPERNTDDLIAALPAWYAAGLRAFTVGFQGGGPCFTVANGTVDNNPFGADGTAIDRKYQARMARLIDAADKLGMIVIVSLFYCGQIHRLDGAQAILNAVRTACAFLREGGWRNVIIEVANEYDIPPYHVAPLIQQPQGMVGLIDLARRESGMLVGSSGGGGTVDREVVLASDVALFHGNGQTRQQMVRCIEKIRSWAQGLPIVCNEDSQALTNLQVCLDMGVSWGYYNNMTKQEPPADWGVTKGEDQFFAWRMAEWLGLRPVPIPEDSQFVLMGLSPFEMVDGKCWPRMASLCPEGIDHVDFYQNGKHIGRCYEDPFTLNYLSNWLQGPHYGTAGEWRAVATLRNGEVVERTASVEGD